VRRTCWSLGYDYEMIIRTEGQNHEEIFRTKIIESIEKKRPVIAYGIIGPPDEGIVTGYDKNGQILVGRSYFHDSSKGYYEKDDWYESCLGLILIGNKKKSPHKSDIYLEALKWAVLLANTPDLKELANNNRHLGFAAFDVWIDALKNDAYFPKDNVNELTLACQIHSNVTLSGLLDSRRAGVGFLKGMADDIEAGKNDILKAIIAYEEEIVVLTKGMKLVPFSWQSEEKRRQIADPTLRSNLADLILKAKEKEIQAVEHIERAIKEMR